MTTDSHRFSQMKAIVVSLLLLALPSASAADERTIGADLALVSSVAAIQPGVPFTAAIHIRHHEGYHTYWKNPGIVGVPTSIEWTLPEGFAAGPIQWPAPEVVDMATHPAHGYHRDVLLLVDITPPMTIAADSVALEADLAWMACARDCNPGFATRQLNLPVTRDSKPKPDNQWAARIDQERRNLPAPSDHWKVTLESKRGESPIRIRVTPTDKHAGDPGEIYFFSADGQISSEPPQTVERLDDSTYLITAERSEWGPDEYDGLPGTLVASGSWVPDKDLKSITAQPAYPD